MTAWRPAWPGFSARGTLVLPLPNEAFAHVPPTMAIDGLELTRKREFHLSLLDRARVARMHAPRAGGPAAARLPALFDSLDWGWRLRGERWLLLAAKPEGAAHSLIELLEVPAFAAFRAAAGRLIGETLPLAPAHVTLYVAGDAVGIGVPSQAAFERLRVRPV